MNRPLRLFKRSICLFVIAGSVVPSAAFGAQTSQVTFHLSFRTVARHAFFPTGSGAYVAFSTWRYPSRHPGRFVLLNDTTGKRTVVNACGARQSTVPPSTFGDPWLAFDCSSIHKRPFQLYNVHTHQWRRLRCDRACTRYYQYLSILGVGTKWLVAYVQPHQWCGPSDPEHYECGPSIYLYYNIATSKRGSPRPGANDVLNLNSPTLTSRVCDPVSVPSGSPTIPPPLGIDRGFAFVRSPSGVYVQRCGSPQQTYLTTDPSAYDIAPFWSTTKSFFGNQHAAGFFGPVREAQPQPAFFGVFLPSLTRFTATGLPIASPGVLLGPHHLYVWSNGQLIAAAFPSAPPPAGG